MSFYDKGDDYTRYNELILHQLLTTTFVGNVYGQQMGI